MEKKKKKVGRPSLYKKKYCQEIIEYFDRDLTYKKEVEKIEYGKAITIKIDVPSSFPTFGEFARKVANVDHSTLLDWTKKNEEFAKAYNESKQIQQDFLVKMCLLGHYNGNFGRFTMKNISKWRDNIDTHISTDKGGFKLSYNLESEKK